ncbi:MAG: hypothetical protein Fur0022_08890 [Anaerolineales bacterium]
MTTFPLSPKLLKGGLVLVNPASGVAQRIIVLQYNPETISRTLQAQTVGENGDRAQAFRLIGPPQESYKLEAVIDAADQMEFPDANQTVRENGILPQLAVVEKILYPESSRLIANNNLAGSGTLEIIPAEGPLTLFVWSKNRVMPVRLTEFSVTEEAFDPNLNPIRAKVSLGLRVLNINDLGFDHRGGNLYMAYHQRIEQLATLSKSGVLGQLGITGI